MKATLKMLRANKNRSLREVASDTGISANMLSRWENGEGLTVKNLLKLLDYYGADLSEVDLTNFLCPKN